MRCDTVGPFLREIVNRRIFPWLQIPCSSLRMAGAIDMMAAAQLPKIRDKTQKEKARRNNLMVWQFPTYPPVHYAKKEAFIFQIGLPAKASL